MRMQRCSWKETRKHLLSPWKKKKKKISVLILMVIIYERNRIHMGIAFSENGYTKEVFDLADEALYKSKSAGKHAITINDFVVKK